MCTQRYGFADYQVINPLFTSTIYLDFPIISEKSFLRQECAYVPDLRLKVRFPASMIGARLRIAKRRFMSRSLHYLKVLSTI